METLGAALKQKIWSTGSLFEKVKGRKHIQTNNNRKLIELREKYNSQGIRRWEVRLNSTDSPQDTL